jgi:CxxC-x17-CxxC domain-containing protein
MGDFNRGGSRGGRSFGGDRGASKFGGRGADRGGRGGFGGRTEMHRATCSECGQSCEVPFRPTGERPVFCSSCFEKQGAGAGRDRGGFGGERRERSERPRFERSERPRFEDKQMFSASCDKCGVNCQVPFKPTPGKPVFCDACFGSKLGDKEKNSSELNDQIKSLHIKMDKILKLLNVNGVVVKDEKVEKIEKTESKKKEIEKIVEAKAVEVKKAPVVKKEKAPAKAKVVAKKVVAKKKK